MGKERSPNGTKDFSGRANIFPKADFWFSHHVSIGCHLSHSLWSCFAKFSFPSCLSGNSTASPSASSRESERDGPGSYITRVEIKSWQGCPASQLGKHLEPSLLTLVIWMLFSCCCQCRIVSMRYTHMLMFPTSTHLPTRWTSVHKDV